MAIDFEILVAKEILEMELLEKAERRRADK